MSRTEVVYEWHRKCLDCRREHNIRRDGFMATDRVWKKYTALHERQKFLCRKCFQYRMGRSFLKEDLKWCPLSSWPLILATFREYRHRPRRVVRKQICRQVWDTILKGQSSEYWEQRVQQDMELC